MPPAVHVLDFILVVLQIIEITLKLKSKQV
jgi:hypothetical protein